MRPATSFQRTGILLPLLRINSCHCNHRNVFGRALLEKHARSFCISSSVKATHKDKPTTGLLSQSLDQRQRLVRETQQDTAGPFALGSPPQPLGPKEKIKKWSELSTKGKVLRTTVRTTNFTVIVLGAGLTALLAYALASELFARNSPTVLYGEACERIKEDGKIAQLLPGTLVFHNNPPTNLRPRHRARHVSSQLAVDASGREHLILNFYVRSAGNSSSRLQGESFVDRMKDAAGVMEELSLQGVKTWARDTWQRMRESTSRLFRYLTGESVSSNTSFPYGSSVDRQITSSTSRRGTQVGQSSSEESGGLWTSVTGLFSSIGKSLGSVTRTANGKTDDDKREIYEEGEVHCDLVKNDKGDYVFRYIIVDMPSSRALYPKRVFVERIPGVKDSEAVVRWV